MQLGEGFSHHATGGGFFRLRIPIQLQIFKNEKNCNIIIVIYLMFSHLQIFVNISTVGLQI